MRRITALAMATLLALAAGACGSDGDSTTSDTQASTGGGSTTGDDGSSSDGSNASVPAGLVDEDCQFLLAGAFLNPLAAATPGSESDVGDSAAQLEAIAAEAPEEIQDAMATISDAYAQMADALKDVDLQDPQSYTDPEVAAALEDLSSVFDEDYEQASQTVSDYVTDNCSG